MKRKKLKMENLPVYEIVVDEEDNSGMRFISLVENPAIEIKGYAFAKSYDLQPNDFNSRWHTHPNCNCSFSEGSWTVVQMGEFPCDSCLEMKSKYEDWYSKRGTSATPGSKRFSDMEFSIQKDKQIIAGPTMIPNKKIYRKDGDMEYYVTFSPETIKTIVGKFVKENNNRSINLEHSNVMVPAFIMEHWIVEDTTYDKSKMYGFSLPVGSHFVTIKIEDENFWNNEVKNLNKIGFSIEGILGQKLIHMASDTERVSFDYHGVLNTKKGFDKAKEMIDEGYEIHIVTNASESESGRQILKVADELGIPSSHIHYAHGDKESVIKRMNISKHYDDNESIVKEIREKTDAKTIQMSEIDEVIMTLTEDEIKWIMDFYVEPGKGEREDDFIGRCMSKLVGDEGKEQDQSYAICKNIWDTK